MRSGTLPVFGMDLAGAKYWIFAIGLAVVLYTMIAWWSDTIKEAHEGHHTRVVSLHLRYGMIMFIASEVMFFVAWFWAFFDASLFPNEAAQVARAESIPSTCRSTTPSSCSCRAPRSPGRTTRCCTTTARAWSGAWR
jgi:cytochrome c oxidase subunit 3